VFVEKSGECVVVSVNNAMKISMRVSDEPRVGNITLELSDTDRFEASERECRQRRRRHLKENVDNGGGGI